MSATNSSSRLPTAVRQVEHIVGNAQARSRQDSIAVEEPLEIRLRIAGEPRPGTALSVTMRTPGDDADLAMGFLFGEGVVRGLADVAQLAHCGSTGQVIAVELAAGVPDPRGRLQRNFYTTSSCGVCGKSSIEAVLATVPTLRDTGMLVVERNVLTGLPGKLAAQQALFACTGGIHAAALFSADGVLLCVREDVGRHNATATRRICAFRQYDAAAQRPREFRAAAESSRRRHSAGRRNRRTVQSRDRARR
jgi:FdhD protein